MAANLLQPVSDGLEVEDTLNGLLDAEADRLARREYRGPSPNLPDVPAAPFGQNQPSDARSGSRPTPGGRSLTVETAIIERHRRRQTSVEEAVLEMSLAGVATPRIEEITEALWGARASPRMVGELNQKIVRQIDAWRHQPISGEHAYVFLDGIWLKSDRGSDRRYMSVLMAIGVNQDGYREVLGVEEGTREDQASWRTFLQHLKERGLSGVRLFVGDRYFGLKESVMELYPEAAFQRCVGHFYRYVESLVPVAHLRSVVTMLKAIHASEDRVAAEAKAAQVVRKLGMLKLPAAAAAVAASIGGTLSFYAFPSEHHRSLRTSSPLERIMREIRLRARVVCTSPDRGNFLLLVSARRRQAAGRPGSVRRFMDMSHLRQLESGLAASLKQAS